MKVKLVQDSEVKTKINSSLRQGLEDLAKRRNQSVSEALRTLVAEAVVNAISSGELEYDQPVQPENDIINRMNEAFKQAGKERRSITFE